jgi:hypothetical protein
MKANEFDRRFDEGGSVNDALDWSRARRPNVEIKRVNVDFPAWVVAELDQEAQRLGITRQALVKVWIAERLRKSEHAAE